MAWALATVMGAVASAPSRRALVHGEGACPCKEAAALGFELRRQCFQKKGHNTIKQTQPPMAGGSKGGNQRPTGLVFMCQQWPPLLETGWAAGTCVHVGPVLGAVRNPCVPVVDQYFLFSSWSGARECSCSAPPAFPPSPTSLYTANPAAWPRRPTQGSRSPDRKSWAACFCYWVLEGEGPLLFTLMQLII